MICVTLKLYAHVKFQVLGTPCLVVASDGPSLTAYWQDQNGVSNCVWCPQNPQSTRECLSLEMDRSFEASDVLDVLSVLMAVDAQTVLLRGPKMEDYRGTGFLKSALILPVRESESIAQPSRRNYTTDGAMGLLPHVTILYPFVAFSEWGACIREALETSLGRVSPFSFELAQLNRFPAHRALFLDPVPSKAIRDLTRIVTRAFPNYPPYEGTIPIDELHPHVTIAMGSTDQELVEIEKSFSQEIADRLPLAVTAHEVWFVVKSGNRWQHHTTIELGAERDRTSGCTQMPIGAGDP